MDHQRQGNLAVIPARGGSRRLPGKNIRRLAGQPAIAYTIAAARESGLFERIVVTTDSDVIAAVAQQHGAEVPFVREATLSDDHTPVSMATLDALDRLDARGSRFVRVAQLMATCPLRTADDVRHSFEHFVESGSGAQISVTRFALHNPWWAMRRGPGSVLEPLFDGHATARSQDLPDLFCPSGAIWWALADALRQARTFHQPGRLGWELPWQRGIDIDTEDDWRLAELLVGATV